jgi:hypothetical protein
MFKMCSHSRSATLGISQPTSIHDWTRRNCEGVFVNCEGVMAFHITHKRSTNVGRRRAHGTVAHTHTDTPRVPTSH